MILAFVCVSELVFQNVLLWIEQYFMHTHLLYNCSTQKQKQNYNEINIISFAAYGALECKSIGTWRYRLN